MNAVVAALSLGQLQTVCAKPHESGAVKRIVFFGDSLTDAFRLSRDEGYPALIAQKLRAAGLTDFDVVNAGVSGDTSGGGVRRLPNYLRKPIDIFALELGVNDAFRNTPVDDIRGNLQSIIDQVRAANPNVQIIVIGMQFATYGNDAYVGEFSAMYSDLAAKNNAALVPSLLAGVAGDPNLNLPDRVHPNAAGHRILAENVWRVLEPIARRVAGG
jgi:acyl-CoA thioesterase-1